MPQFLCQIQLRYLASWVVPTLKTFPQQEHRIRRWFATSSFFKILLWSGRINLVTSLPRSSEFPIIKKQCRESRADSAFRGFKTCWIYQLGLLHQERQQNWFWASTNHGITRIINRLFADFKGESWRKARLTKTLKSIILHTLDFFFSPLPWPKLFLRSVSCDYW